MHSNLFVTLPWGVVALPLRVFLCCLLMLSHLLWLALLMQPDDIGHDHWRIAMTTASPPRLSISPVRFAFRCMITPASFCSQRSPALAVPIAKP